jgi:hypothetical protein
MGASCGDGGGTVPAAARLASGGIVEPRAAGAVDIRTVGGGGGAIDGDDARCAAGGSGGVTAGDDDVMRGAVIAADDEDARGSAIAGDDASGRRDAIGSGSVGRGCSRVACGARERGSGATSPALCIGGIVDVIRAGYEAGGALNRSAPGSAAGIGFLFCTRSISSLTAVDSVFPMRARALRMRFGRSSKNSE